LESKFNKIESTITKVLFFFSQGLEFIKVGRCIDVTSFDEENDENNSESLDSSQDDHLE
jgi:hypothetical protein